MTVFLIRSATETKGGGHVREACAREVACEEKACRRGGAGREVGVRGRWRHEGGVAGVLREVGTRRRWWNEIG